MLKQTSDVKQEEMNPGQSLESGSTLGTAAALPAPLGLWPALAQPHFTWGAEGEGLALTLQSGSFLMAELWKESMMLPAGAHCLGTWLVFPHLS